MRPHATISHQTPTRLRLQIPRYKGNRKYFAHLRDELSKCAGVETVIANPQTANVLIHHRSTPEEIARFAEEMQLFMVALEEAPLQPASIATLVNKRVGALNAKLSNATKGSLDLPSVSAIGFVALGLFQTVVRRNLLPDGGTMFWWAASLLARHYQESKSKSTVSDAEITVKRQLPRRPRKRAPRASRA